ncbi:MAG: peptide ABC transporter substrate-binding protein [Oscillospiraceae bacterium]|nr:peptide ABC transporter substrate-binding protein [Oscillospiraceae bacterium]
MKKRFLALTIACLCLITVMAACATDSSGGQSSAGGSDIKGYFASTPETIDPQMNSSMDGATYLVHLFQGLYRFKWDGTGVEFGDAESVDISADGLTWTFKLRSDIKWSDGKAVTAHDYEYAWKRLCDPETGAPYADTMAAFLFNGMEVVDGDLPVDSLGAKALDDRTFEVKLSGPCPFFEEIAVFVTLYPVRKDIIEANGEAWWTNPATFISNGAFKTQSYLMDDQLVIVPNEHYYDVGKVLPASISFVFLADEDIAYSAFQAKQIDIGNNVPTAEIESLKQDGSFLLLPELGTYYLSFNVDAEPYNNPLVRKALTLAIDRDYISDELMEGTRISATAFVGDGFSDADPTKDFRAVGGEFISRDYEANKAAAIAALAEAGYPNGEGFPTVEYMYNTSSSHLIVAEAVAKDWEEVLGIKTNLVNQEWAVFLETRRLGNFEVARNGWISDWNDPSSMLSLFRTGDGNNDCNYSNAQFDQYMSESYQSSDQNVRMQALHNAEKILMDEWGCAPIFYYMQTFMVDSGLKGWTTVPLGYTMFHLASK